MTTKEAVCNTSQLSVKKIILSIFFLLVLCRTAGAQDARKGILSAADAGTCTANSTACSFLTIPSGSGGVTFTITSNASANTIQVEATGDTEPTGSHTWVALNVVPSNGTTAVTSTTSTGTWQANIAGFTQVRLRCSTFVGGTTTTYINLSTASARSNGGGGSVTHTAGNLTAFHIMIGNGAADATVDSACVTNGTGALSGCTSISAGSGASSAGATATGGFAAVEAASTGWTPTAGQDYCRADSTLHSFVCSENGLAEVVLGNSTFSGITTGTNTTATMTVGTGATLNGATTGIFDMSPLTTANNFKIPVIAGGAPTANGAVTYDSTANELKASISAATNIVPTVAGTTNPTSGRAAFWGANGTLAAGVGTAFISAASGSVNISANGSDTSIVGVANLLGTSDLFYQASPSGGAAYTVFEDAGVVGLGFTTSGTRPIVMAPNRVITARFPSGGGLDLGSGTDTNISRDAAGVVDVGNGTQGDVTGTIKPGKYATGTNCSGVGTAANPSVATCTSAAAGSFSCATNASTGTCQVNTTAVTANSQIFVQEDNSLGTKLSVTCNANNVLPATAPLLGARNGGTSFTINLGTFTTNPLCFSYFIVN